MLNPCDVCVVVSCCTMLCSKKKIYNYMMLAKAEVYTGKIHKQKLRKTIEQSRKIMQISYPESMALSMGSHIIISILTNKRVDNSSYDFYCENMLEQPKEIKDVL